jgi:pre-mRNA-splicing factor ISY1
LSPDALKELNDEINRLLSEKLAWERRIVELGGKNYFRERGELPSSRLASSSSAAAAIDQGDARYQYFGAAKHLPSVQKHLDRQRQRELKAQQRVDADRRLRRLADIEYFAYDENERRRQQDSHASALDDDEWQEPSIPSQQEIDAAILDYHKQSVLRRFVQ